jgi:hypothetical protein
MYVCTYQTMYFDRKIMKGQIKTKNISNRYFLTVHSFVEKGKKRSSSSQFEVRGGNQVRFFLQGYDIFYPGMKFCTWVRKYIYI